MLTKAYKDYHSKKKKEMKNVIAKKYQSPIKNNEQEEESLCGISGPSIPSLLHRYPH